MRVDELFDDSDDLYEDWKKVNRKDKTDGMSRKAVKAYRRENPGSKLQTAVTTKPSKLKKGSKSAKRRKSFCARMRGMKKAHAGAKTKRNPDSPINKALRRWNCESIEEMRNLIVYAEQVISEEKQRLDAKCWTGYKKQGTKMKGGVRVNNCVPVDEAEIPSVYSKQVPPGMEHRARYKCPNCGIANKVQDWAANDNECPTCLEPLPHGLNQMPLKYQVAEENKGLYYNVNKRKKAGISRDKDHPKAPTAQAWKDAAKTAKKEGVDEGLGYSQDPEQARWYHRGRKAAQMRDGYVGDDIRDIAKRYGCPAEWLGAFRAGWQDQEGWGKLKAIDEARKPELNFDINDIKRLEQIKDVATLKAQAMALIAKPSAKPMKPEKVEWFRSALDRMDSPMKIIKLMYDLLLSGEGHQVIGSRGSMNPNSYRSRFGEDTEFTGYWKGQDKRPPGKHMVGANEAVNLDRSKNAQYPNDPATQKHRLDTAKRLLSDPKTDPDSRREAAAIIARMEPKGKA